MTDLRFDELQLMLAYPEAYMQGPQGYVGTVSAVTGTLFFNCAHLPEMREAICACFDEYEAIAGHHLTWLWRAEPPEGPDKIAYL